MERSNPQETGEQRKRILYVERDYLDGRCPDSLSVRELCYNQGYQGFKSIAASLRQRFDLECMYNLDEMVLERIQSAISKRRFNALVTHLPYEENREKTDWRERVLYPMPYYSASYGKSLGLIERIKDSDPDIAILVYTGMPKDYHHLPLDSGADRVIRKSSDIENDVNEVNFSLDYFFKELPRIRIDRKERAKQPPKIIIDKGKTIVEAIVNLRGGIGYYTYSKMGEESRKYSGNVNLVDITEGKTGDCKDIMTLLSLCVIEGKPIRISIDGDDSEAQKLAKRLYSAITSEEERKISFDRFD
jgi:phosphotransferase system HPr-like phosphotransfer protein